MLSIQLGSMSWFSALTFGSCGLFLLSFFVYMAALPRPILGIPYNKDAAKSVLGDLPQMSAYQKRTKEQRRWFAAQTAKFNSPICQVFIRPFGKPRVVLSDFREMQDILMRRIKEFDRSERVREAWMGIIPHQMLSYKTVDPKFKKHRELMRDLMSPMFLNEVSAPEIYSKANALIGLWKEKSACAAERSFDAKQDIQRAALDVITAVSFGLSDEESATRRQLNDMLSRPQRDTASDGSQSETVQFPLHPLTLELQATLTIIESASVGFSSPFPRWHHWFMRQFSYMKDAARVREEWTRREIDKAVKAISEGGTGNPTATRTALEYMVRREATAAQKTQREPRFHRRRIYDELFGFIIAGHDTTATTLCWGLMYIADAPTTQVKLRSRLQDVFSQAHVERRQPTVAELTKTPVPYLDAVIEEILRLSVVIPIVSREAMVDTTILGHAIPKGTQVLFAFNGPSMVQPTIEVPEAVRSEGSQQTKDKYGQWGADDISRFIPERWIELDDKGTETYSSMKGPILTFGSGPRGCFGRKLGYLELRIVLSLLVWNFEFLPVPPHLRSAEVVENVTVEPTQCFVRLKEVEK